MSLLSALAVMLGLAAFMTGFIFVMLPIVDWLAKRRKK